MPSTAHSAHALFLTLLVFKLAALFQPSPAAAAAASGAYGTVTVVASAGIATMDLDAGICAVAPLPLHVYSLILNANRTVAYGVNLTHVMSFDPSSGKPITVLAFDNPTPEGSSPTFWLGYELDGLLYGWLQDDHVPGDPYSYSLCSVDPYTGVVTVLDRMGCAVPGRFALDANNSRVWMQHEDCNFGGSDMYEYDARNGTELSDSSLAWFTVFGFAYSPQGMYAVACTDNTYGSIFFSPQAPYVDYTRLSSSAIKFDCYTDFEPAGLIQVANGDLSTLFHNGTAAYIAILDDATGVETKRIDIAEDSPCVNMYWH